MTYKKFSFNKFYVLNIQQQDAVNEEDLSRIAMYNKKGVELCDILRDIKTQADESLQGVTQLLKYSNFFTVLI